MSNRTAPTPMAELVETLWYERRLLEFLLFKLVSANLVLSSADRRYVGPAVDEVEQVLERVRRAESDRHEVVQRLAPQPGALLRVQEQGPAQGLGQGLGIAGQEGEGRDAGQLLLAHAAVIARHDRPAHGLRFADHSPEGFRLGRG